jgi:hypothetical protein
MSQLLLPEERLAGLVGELERWGELFIRMGREDRLEAAEQVLGGLVEWMGNGLVEGWLYLPIPVFERLSNLAEELMLEFQGALRRLRDAPRPLATDDRAPHEVAIGDILARASGLTVRV